MCLVRKDSFGTARKLQSTQLHLWPVTRFFLNAMRVIVTILSLGIFIGDNVASRTCSTSLIFTRCIVSYRKFPLFLCTSLGNSTFCPGLCYITTSQRICFTQSAIRHSALWRSYFQTFASAYIYNNDVWCFLASHISLTTLK